ncbi:hypothetical protein [Pseudarthrobacter sp. PvP090]
MDHLHLVNPSFFFSGVPRRAGNCGSCRRPLTYPIDDPRCFHGAQFS